MKPLAKMFLNFKDAVANNFKGDPGKMLVHTGTFAWILSSLAQVGAIVFNDKIPPEQKSFLIPQEIGDALANIFSFYVITSSIRRFASKLVTTGKIATPSIRTFLRKNNLASFADPSNNYVGKSYFNMEYLGNFKEIEPHYKPFKNGVEIIASTLGAIVSCNIVTPHLRNRYGAREQKLALARMNKTQQMSPKGITMNDYISMSSMKHSGSLKI